MKHVNKQVCIELITIGIFASTLIYLIVTGTYRDYVTPKLLSYLWIMIGLMLLWMINRSRLLYQRVHHIHLKHCYILIIPLILLYVPLPAIKTTSLPNKYTSVYELIAKADEVLAASSESNIPESTEDASRLNLPFIRDGLDQENKHITVNDDYFYKWIVEISAHMNDYIGYSVTIKGFAYISDSLFDEEQFGIARLLMTCCSADLTPVGLTADYNRMEMLVPDSWYLFNGTIVDGIYNDQRSPIIHIIGVEMTARPNNYYVYP